MENENKKEYGLALAGGGTKGAYEVGAWKAIKEIGLNITAISGTSIGAINAALMVQDDFDNLMDIYDIISLENVIDINEKLNPNKDIFSPSNIIKLTKDYARQKGFNNSPLEKMMYERLDLDKIYDSKVDLGIMTYSVKSRRSLEVFKSELPKEEMIKHLLASSCFPIFKAQKIGDMEYYDGGFYDNLPVNMLIKKGYKNIIAIDIIGLSIKKKPITMDINLKTIKPTEDLGGLFEFNRERIKHNIQLGYLDTMRAFNKLQGHIYYFKPLEFSKLIDMFSLDTIYGLEFAAKVYNIDKYKIYDNANEFLNELCIKHKDALQRYEKVRSSLDFVKIVKERKELKKIIDKGLLLCLFTDMIANKPAFRNIKLVNKLFSSHLLASEALMQLDC